MGLGVKYGSLVNATAQLRGNEVDPLADLGFTVSLTPFSKVGLGLDLGVLLDLRENRGVVGGTWVAATDTVTGGSVPEGIIDNIDVSAVYRAGKAALRLGYVITETGTFRSRLHSSYSAFDASVLPKGGLYFDLQVSY